MEENYICQEYECYICQGYDEYCPNCGSRVRDKYTEE